MCARGILHKLGIKVSFETFKERYVAVPIEPSTRQTDTPFTHLKKEWWARALELWFRRDLQFFFVLGAMIFQNRHHDGHGSPFDWIQSRISAQMMKDACAMSIPDPGPKEYGRAREVADMRCNSCIQPK